MPLNPKIAAGGTVGAARWIVPGMLALGALLALSSLLQDSVTFDEPLHVAAGYSYLRTGDFRLGPDHPPLGKLLLALPLCIQDPRELDRDSPAWRGGNGYAIGPAWLFDGQNGQRLVTHARLMVVLLLIALWLCIWQCAKALFGVGAGRLALALAVLCPTLLAHGRLATLDLPATLTMWLTLAAYARLLRRFGWVKLLLASLALAAASLTKFSWPLLLPALLLMGVLAVRAIPERPSPTKAERSAPLAAAGVLSGRAHVFRLLLILLCSVVAVWLAVWTGYGWRYRPFTGPDRERAFMAPFPDALPYPHDMDGAWYNVSHMASGERIGGLIPAFIEWARAGRILPEPYLFGLAFQRKATLERRAYMLGAISSVGWTGYFPLAFAIKTPVPTLLLLGAGIAALVMTRRTPSGDPLLLAGLVAFAVVYAAVAVSSRYNIGHRHLLPLYPAVLILASGAARLAVRRWGRGLIAVLLAWLALSNALAYPDYLSYFNELIGGPANGAHYLADSNLDWGQDLLRLKRWADGHPQAPVKLAYHGTVNPRAYVPRAEMLASEFNFNWGPQCALSPGAYVVSVTQALGVYNEAARPEYWRQAANRESFLAAYTAMARHQDGTAPLPPEELMRVNAQLGRLQPSLLISRLAARRPDERIGRSLLVYRLSAADLRVLLQPPGGS